MHIFLCLLPWYRLKYIWSHIIQDINEILALIRPHFRALSVIKWQFISFQLTELKQLNEYWPSKEATQKAIGLLWWNWHSLKYFRKPPFRIWHRPSQVLPADRCTHGNAHSRTPAVIVYSLTWLWIQNSIICLENQTFSPASRQITSEVGGEDHSCLPRFVFLSST